MLKLFYERLKVQTGLAFIPVMIVASLVITGLGLWSVGTEAQKTIDNKKELATFAEEKNTEDPEVYQEQINKALVKTAVEGGKVAVGTVAGVHDTYLVNTALDAAGAFDTEKRKTTKLDKLDLSLLSEEEANSLMQLTEDELDLLLEGVDTHLTNQITGEEVDIGLDEWVDSLLEETKNLNYGIKKVVEKKVELNSDPKTTPEEKKTIVDETIKNIQKAEDNNKKADLNSWVKTLLKGSDKLADQHLIDLRYQLKKNELSYDYNFSIIEQYEEYQAKGQIISDTSELAEAKRRIADIYDETIAIEAKIKELEDAKIAASAAEESKGLIDETQPDDTTPENTTDATQTDDTTQETNTQPAELKLTGMINYIMDSTGPDFSVPITLNINFETGIVSGTYKFEGPKKLNIQNVWKVVQTTEEGTINGKIDVNSKIIDADIWGTGITASSDIYGNGIWGTGSSGGCSYEFYTKLSGTLDENNNATGTTDEIWTGIISVDWVASPQ